MKRKTSVSIFFIFLLSFYLFSQTDDIIIAVSDFQNYSGVQNLEYMSKGIADAIIYQLGFLDGISIVERSAFNNVLNELQLGMSGLMNDLTVQKIGKQLSANVMIVGGYEYNSLTKLLRINARIVDVETGLIIDSETVIDSEIYADDLQKNIAKKIKSFFVSKYNLKDTRMLSKSTANISSSLEDTNNDVTYEAVPEVSNFKDFINLFFITHKSFKKVKNVSENSSFNGFIKNFFQK